MIMERLQAMFSNADEVQGDSVPPHSANSCSAYINLLIHLRKLDIWGTPLTVHNNTTKALFSLPVLIYFLLYSFEFGSLVISFGGAGEVCCSVFSLRVFLPSPFVHYSCSPWLFSSIFYHLSQVLHKTQNSIHKNSITERRCCF